MTLNKKHIAALLAASAMAFGIDASAQPGPGAGMGPGGGMGGGMGMDGCPMAGGAMKGDPAARAEQHLAQFKEQLKITPQQEPLWQAFAEKAKASAGQGMKAMQSQQQQPMTAPERMNRMLDHMKQHTAAMEAVSDSFKHLYDALTPEQKAIADKHHPMANHMGQKRGGPGSGGMGGRGGQPGQGPGGMAPAR